MDVAVADRRRDSVRAYRLAVWKLEVIAVEGTGSSSAELCIQHRNDGMIAEELHRRWW